MRQSGGEAPPPGLEQSELGGWGGLCNDRCVFFENERTPTSQFSKETWCRGNSRMGLLLVLLRICPSSVVANRMSMFVASQGKKRVKCKMRVGMSGDVVSL